MLNNIITPWEEPESQQGFFVPEYIEQMAWDVLEEFDFQTKSMECVTTKADKGGAIWKLETSEGPKSLKLLHRRPTRSLFSLAAQEYLVHVQNARVPEIIKTKTGSYYVLAGGMVWFVAEWIEPLAPVSKDLEGAKQLCYAIGEFHRLTRGFTPPPEVEVSSRLYKWPKQYEKIIRKMDWFRNIASLYDDMPASSRILDVVDYFEEQAIDSYRRLMESKYKELVQLGKEYWGLAHQDYGWSNGQMGPGGMWIIDLDGVSYDLAIRDLSKLITGSMTDLGYWDFEWAKGMIEAYNEANPIPPELYEILLIDLSLPMDFYKNVKEMVYEPELFLNEETRAMVDRIAETDRSKRDVLDQLMAETLATGTIDWNMPLTESVEWQTGTWEVPALPQEARASMLLNMETMKEKKKEKRKEKKKEKLKVEEFEEKKDKEAKKLEKKLKKKLKKEKKKAKEEEKKLKKAKKKEKEKKKEGKVA